MPKLSKRLLLAFAVTVVAGTCLHFLYDLLPNPVTALFSPVRESLWEHVKILFWPYLAAFLLLTRGGEPGTRTPWMLTAPLLCAVMLALGWIYYITLGGEAMWVDLVLYALIMALGFWLPTRFSGPFPAPLWLLPGAAAAVLGILFGLFTLWPPQHIVFSDLSALQTWYQIPC